MTTPTATPQKKSFLVNVFWSWTGIAISLFSAAVLTPYMTRKLGDEGYGVWVLAFSLVENYWLLDLGFRSATAKFTAQYLTTNETENVNRVISTSFGYFSLIAVLVSFATLVGAPFVTGRFQIEPQYRLDFQWLVILVGISWASGAIGMVFQASLEGFQRFDVVSRILLVTSVIRVAGTIAVLMAGRSLVALGLAVVGSQLVGHVLFFISFRRVFPALRLNWRLIEKPMLKQMAGYGIHTVTATAATQMLNQAGPVFLGIHFPTSAVGYFNTPNRLMQLTGVEVAARVGVVSTSKSAQLAALEDTPGIVRLAVITNRYCLMLFLMPAAFLLTFGTAFLNRWLGPTWGASSGPLLPIMIVSTALGVAAQFNSSSILYGLAKHSLYARGMLVEGILNVGLLWFVVPRYGLMGLVWTSGILMILNRGIFLPWVLCRVLGEPFGHFMRAVLLRPLLALVPVLAVGVLLASWLTGETWPQLILAGGFLSALYALIGGVFCVEPEHLDLAKVRARRLLGWA